jgi:hypothetical protein
MSILPMKLKNKDRKCNWKSFELWKIKMEYLLVKKYKRIIVDPGTTPIGMSTKD